MEDIFKKVKELDKQEIEQDNPFMDKIIKDYRKTNEMFDSFHQDTPEKTFSSDIEKFDKDCIEFINYIKYCISKSTNKSCVLYLHRISNSIFYGRFEQGFKMNQNTIDMVSNEDLRILYSLLKEEFKEDFIDGCKHTFSIGWTLTPFIGNHIMIDIDSDNQYDRLWFYDESHKEEKSESQIKK